MFFPTHIIKNTAAFVLVSMLVVALSIPSQACAVPASQLKAQAAAALDKLNDLEDKFNVANAAYLEAKTAADEARQKKEDAQAQIKTASERIVNLKGRLSARARGMYRNGAISFLDVLTSAASFKAFTLNWAILNDMNQSDADMVRETKELRQLIEQQEKEAAAQEVVESEKAAQAKSVNDEAERLVEESRAVYNSLSAEAAAAVEEERANRGATAAQNFLSNLGSNKGSSNKGSSSAASSYTPGSVVSRAMSKVGNAQYVSAAVGPDAFDCSGFVSWCLLGYPARLGNDRYFGNKPIAADPQPGDVCWRPGHVGIYIGNGQMVNASSPTRGIVIDYVDSRYTIHRM